MTFAQLILFYQEEIKEFKKLEQSIGGNPRIREQIKLREEEIKKIQDNATFTESRPKENDR